MKIARWGGAAIAGAALGLAMASPGYAQQTETFAEPGPVDLSGSDHATGNVGQHVQLGALELGPGEWEVTASVRLFVPDAGETKNSQGCGLYVAGEQIGGAGGSSSLWTAAEGGKEVVFTTFLVPPDWTDTPIVVAGPAEVVLECFIDQSHSGAQLEQRTGMAATDIALEATGGEPDPDPSPTGDPTKPEPTDDPAPGKGGAADEELPTTGLSMPMLLGGAGVLGLAGGGTLWATRRRRVSFTA